MGCALILALIYGCASDHGTSRERADTTSRIHSGDAPGYTFSTDWFTHHIPTWEKYLDRFKGQPRIHYLEIGVFEGRSALWMLENILTHPSARLTGIDTFPGDLKERFLANVRTAGFGEKVTVIAGRSQRELRRLPLDSFDIIYIDGSHAADEVLADAVLSWALLKPGGIVIFDDYAWARDVFPNELRPQVAIDAFLETHKIFLDILYRDTQVLVRKRASAYRDHLLNGGAIHVGRDVFSYHDGTLYRFAEKEAAWNAIALSGPEQAFLDEVTETKMLERDMMQHEQFVNLVTRLGVTFDVEHDEPRLGRVSE